MIIEWKIKSGDFLDMLEIYIKSDGNTIIFDKTSDKIFEKYTKKLCYNIQCYEICFKFVNKEQQNLHNEKSNNFIFTFEFPDEETTFYYQLKYGIENNV